MTPDDIKALRKATALTQRDLADALAVDVSLVRDWEKGDKFPTKAHCDAMEAVRAKPPVSSAKKGKGAEKKPRTPMQLLADPELFALVRKLLAHAPLREAVYELAGKYQDPLDESDKPPA